MKKIVVTLITIIILLILGAGGWYAVSSGLFSSSENNDGTSAVAIVNEEKISRSDFDKLQKQIVAGQGIDLESLKGEELKQLENQIIDELIARTLLRQTAERAGVNISQEEVNEQIELMKSQFGEGVTFEKALSNEGLTESELRSRINNDLTVQSYVNNELDFASITASESEIETAYSQLIEARGAEGEAPSLEGIRKQVEQFVIQQKQQQMLSEFVKKLRTEADVEVLL